MQDWQQVFEIDQLQAQLDGEAQDLQSRAQSGDWGYFLSFKDLGYFSWFKSPQQMLRYLVQVEILHAPTSLPDREHYQQWLARLQPIASQYLADQDAPRALQAFNQVFPDFELRWIGTFEELLSAAEPFASELRLAFQQSSEPIPETQLSAFSDFLESYGL